MNGEEKIIDLCENNKQLITVYHISNYECYRKNYEFYKSDKELITIYVR